MKRAQRKPERLILRAYDAAQDQTQIPALLSEMSRQFAAHAVWMRVHDGGHATPRYLHSTGLSPSEVTRSEAQFSDRNPWRVKGFEDMLMNGVGHGDSILPRHELVRTEYYNEVLAKMDIDYGMGFCLWANPPHQAVVISLNRSQRQAGSFAEDISYAKQLLPHLRSAYAIMRRLSWAESQSLSLAAAIERFGVGMALVDAKGRCVYRNMAAEEAFAAGCGLALTPAQTFRCAVPDAQRTLQAALTLAARDALPAPQRIHVRDALGTIRFVLVVTMLRGDARSLGAKGNDPCAAIFIHTPSLVPKAPDALLREAFLLTPAEARLAALLAMGADVAQCTNTLHVSLATIRTQLRSLFAKTGTHRQAELVAALNFVLRVG